MGTDKNIKTKLLIDVEVNIDDKLADEDTLKFLVEDDLQELKYTVNNVSIFDDDIYYKHYLFGIIETMVFSYLYFPPPYNKYVAAQLRKEFLEQYSVEDIYKIIEETNHDITEQIKMVLSKVPVGLDWGGSKLIKELLKNDNKS